ncbi:TonB-dependent siderophore receptor [Aquirhabdus parva]|uniref:TonB-dependent siderophore receptor n=1 Tax=Aquirhabdus parva TaxID=2283318 RepID=A0A345P7S5_9GAMM|nr:TonB-dependent siderophore receptor [Aquirhabdus parva]AXI03334.1 TonB-dependent siderophore receptor [Aquirhabdus parva]
MRAAQLFTLTTLALATSPYVQAEDDMTEAGREKTLQTITVIGTKETASSAVKGYVAKRSSAGTKTDTALLEIPQSISVITADQIKDQNAQSISEALRYSAGVTAEPYGVDNRGDYYALRGGSSGSVVLDGLRLPLIGSWGSMHDEPYAFQRVEVIRGPSAVTYGQNPPGGLVNLVSKQPQKTAQHEIVIQGGTNDHRQVAVDFTGPIDQDGTLLYRFVGLTNNSGTQVEYAKVRRDYIAPSLTWLPDSKTKLMIYGQYQKDESGNTNAFLPWAGTRLDAPGSYPKISSRLFIGEPDWDSYGGQRTRIGYSFERKLSDDWTLRQNLRHDNANGHYNTMYADCCGWMGPRPSDRTVNRVWYAGQPTSDVTSADLQLEGKLNFDRLEHTLFFGVDSAQERSTNPSVSGLDPTPFDLYAPVYGRFAEPVADFGVISPTRTTQLGISVQDQIKFDHHWVLVAGLRHDHAKVTVDDSANAGVDESAWSRRFGLVYLADHGLAPYLSYSQSFEALAGTDFYGQTFKPKRGEQYEAGLKWSPIGKPYMVSVATFQLKEKNRLTTDPNNPQNQLQLGEVTVKGFELEGNARYQNLEVLGSYTYTNARDTTGPVKGTQLESIPKHSASLWAKYNFALADVSGFSVGSGVRYLGRNWGEGAVIDVPATTLVDALVSYTQDKWSVSLNAKNLFDKEYVATCLGRGDCWLGTRRSLVGSVSYHW